jgi:chloramphenicol 3-O phosphotransferase
LPPPQIIILNGVGSVGKSATARALQAITAAPFLHVAMDTFLDMLPPALFGHPDGLIFETILEDGQPSVALHSGPVVARAMRGMRQAIAAMAGQGNHLIVDDVMIEPGEDGEYRALLSAFDIRLVGLFAPLDVLEARERQRGDRQIGLARWQYDRVHQDRVYDLRLDTSGASPEQTAGQIRDAFGI